MLVLTEAVDLGGHQYQIVISILFCYFSVAYEGGYCRFYFGNGEAGLKKIVENKVDCDHLRMTTPEALAVIGPILENSLGSRPDRAADDGPGLP